jgi:predicted TIM-barrel fold metal-dependent hydrolase
VITTSKPAGLSARVATEIIDCDVHNGTRRLADLKPYMPPEYHGWLDQGSAVSSHELLTIGAKPSPHIYRDDSMPADGPPGSDLALMREQLLDRYSVRRALLHPIGEFSMLPLQGEIAGVLMRALNDWMAAEWLDADDRLRGAISVPLEDGARSAEEIHRLADDPRWVKVTLTAKTREGLGHAKYWPIWEAADAHDLPVSIHVGGFSGTTTGTGWPPYHVEYQAAHPMDMVAQLASIICAGVLDRFPRLKVVFEEGGLGWLLNVMWRLDRSWRSMRAEVPHLDRLPSETIREHVWLTTQPIDAPERPRSLVRLLEHLDMDDHILLATDYPHWNFDSPERVLPAGQIGRDLQKKIFFGNARDLYFAAELDP